MRSENEANSERDKSMFADRFPRLRSHSILQARLHAMGDEAATIPQPGTKTAEQAHRTCAPFRFAHYKQLPPSSGAPRLCESPPFAVSSPHETTRIPHHRRRRSRPRHRRRRADPRPPRRRGARGLKLGTVTYNIAKDWDVPTIIKNLTEVGLDGVELRTTHKHGVEISLSPAERAEVRKQFEDSPVKIGGLGTTCEYHSPDAAVVRKNIDETKEWVKLAKDLGSPSVKVRPERPAEGSAGREDARADRQVAARVRRVRRRTTASRSSSRCTAPRPRACPASARSSITAATTRRSGLLELEPDRPAGRRLRGELQAAEDQIGQVHMRDLFLEEYPFRALITNLAEMNSRATASPRSRSRPTASGC